MTMKDDIKGKQHLTYDDHDDDDDNAEKEADDKFQGIMTDLVGRIVQSEYEQAWELSFGEGNKYRNWYEGYSKEGNPLEFKKAEEAERLRKQEEVRDKIANGLAGCGVRWLRLCARAN